MTGSQALELINLAASFLANKSPGFDKSPRSDTLSNYIKVSSGATIFEGETQYELDGNSPSFHIGTRELHNLLDEEMDQDHVMTALVSLFHEVCGHGGQIKYEFQKDTDLSKVLALNFFACKASPYYYDNCKPGFSKAYKRQCHEIAAQYIGIRSARSFLLLQPDLCERTVDKWIVDYVNYRVRSRSEFVRRMRPYKTVDEIYGDFEKEFQKMVHAHHPYSTKKSPKDHLTGNRFKPLDKFGRVVIRAAEWHPNGLAQDLIMASVYMEDKDPNEYWRKQMPALRRLDLTRAHPVMPTLPDPKSGSLADLTNMVDEIKAARGEIRYGFP